MFEAAGGPKLTLFNEDFLEWSTSERFDLVCSFGFIEHFNDWPAMIRRHAELVVEGRYLILTTPHFRNLQYALHRLFDTPNPILACGPYGTCEFWLERALARSKRFRDLPREGTTR